MAVKLLLSAEDAAAAAKSSDSVLSLSSPVMQELQKGEWAEGLPRSMQGKGEPG